MENLNHDIIIIGGGGAGLRAAIAAADQDSTLDIAVVSKVYPMRSHTVSAEGGTGAVMRDYDNFDLHSFDTIKGSDFLADQDVVEYFVKEAPKEVIQMEHWGCPLSRDEDGHVSRYTVMFEHGSEKVDTADVKILQSSHHRHMKKKKK